MAPLTRRFDAVVIGGGHNGLVCAAYLAAAGQDVCVLERRRVETSQREQREAVRGLLRDKKLEEAYLLWAQDQRSRAYVELRELAP